MKTLRLILGDQLNYNHTWFEEKNPNTVYVMMEVRQETDYVRHHIQKVLGFFAAMRNFAKHLKKQGHRVTYFKINDEENSQSITKNLLYLIEKNRIEKFEYQLPDEYRLDMQIKDFCKNVHIPSKVFDTEHFLTQRDDLKKFFGDRKEYLMESFYRNMRKKLKVLMSGKQPLGGKWNYDVENRKKWDRKTHVPEPLLFKNNLEEIYDDVEFARIKTIGTVKPEMFIWPINREQSLDLLEFFVKKCLPNFGTLQDAMIEKHWSLFHSRLSFALNTKMLHPLEVVNKAIDQWKKRKNRISLAQIEGFVRQIIGWREYMRGVYWIQMPEYEKMNFFAHKRKLPDYYWTANTRMNCMYHAIEQSLEKAYAHHIQRLMVTGSFALISGIHPDEVDQWYLGIYIDAIQWVEITNTRGMSQYADGGIVGTKPYVGSANYIHKMSDYCNNCYYDKNKKYGKRACPFNSLYWHFYERHRDKLSKNPRVVMMYSILDKKMDSKERTKILKQAENYLQNLDGL